ncbi:MAG: hypothetical protein RLY97_1180 [Pseudomonadota bacterium]
MVPYPFIAVDWGSTNRRVYLIDKHGGILAQRQDNRGLAAIASGGFPAEAAQIRRDFGDYPMLCAGMVGSARGWAVAPYVPCPAGLADLSAQLLWVEGRRTAIVAGLSDAGFDVMRGEEVQFLGAVTSGLAPPDGLICQPGTHCKWARMVGGKVAGFHTSMTGELFALLKNHSLIGEFIQADVRDGPAFQEGVQAGLSGGILGKLFGIRAANLLGMRHAPDSAAPDSAAYASGLLIGTDVGEQHLSAGEKITVMADPHLGALYEQAITLSGASACAISSGASFVAGIGEIWQIAANLT